MLCKCKQTEKLHLSDANKSAFSTFSKASFKASQPPSPRQLPVQVVQNSEYLCKPLRVLIWAPFSLLLGLNRTFLRSTFQDPCVLSTISTVLRTIQVQSLHVGFVPDGLSHHKSRLHRDLAEGEVEILERSMAALRSDCGCFRQGRTLKGGGPHLDDGKSLSEHSGEGDGSFRADEAVAKVDHLHVPQVPQGLRSSAKTT